MQADAISSATPQLQSLVCAGAMVMLRISSLFVFAPVFNSPGIPMRIKAGFVFAITLLMTPVIYRANGAITEITVGGVMSELAVGMVLGLSLMMLSEAIEFASTLLGMQFSFSLVNLIDPMSKIETPVLGQLFSWVSVLVLLSAGLHRTLLAALLKTFAVIPVGTYVLNPRTAAALAQMAGGIFLAGVQLASPVIAAALTVEITIGLVARLSPQLPAMIMSVPIKTMVSYVVLIGSLAVWPWFIERHFDALLTQAGRLLVR
jgi:flagellar biosynthetic protein FliR